MRVHTDFLADKGDFILVGTDYISQLLLEQLELDGVEKVVEQIQKVKTQAAFEELLITWLRKCVERLAQVPSNAPDAKDFDRSRGEKARKQLESLQRQERTPKEVLIETDMTLAFTQVG